MARENCAEGTGAPPPKVRTEAITVVAVDATGEARPGYTVVADGTRCRLRTGGAGPSLPDGMVAMYYCGDSDILVAQGPRTPLLDTSAPGWTVQTMDEAAVSGGDDSIPPRTEVVKVYYAGRD